MTKGFAGVFVGTAVLCFGLAVNDWWEERSGGIAAAIATGFDLWVWLSIWLFAAYLAVLHFDHFRNGALLDASDFQRSTVWVLTVASGLFVHLYVTSNAARSDARAVKAYLDDWLFDEVLRTCEATTSDDGKPFAWRNTEKRFRRGLVEEKNNYSRLPHANYLLYADDSVCIFDPALRSARITFSGPSDE